MTDCRHCHRTIVKDPEDGWVDPEATGDDSVWRETCDANDEDRIAAHEPMPDGPCNDYAPDTLNPDPADRDVCTSCYYRGIDHALPLGAPDGSVYDGAPCRYLSTAGDWCGDCPECETAMLWIHVKLDERDSATAGKDGE